MWEREDKYVGREVQRYRALRKLSQQQLADLVEVTRPYISMIERGDRPVTNRQLLYSLARALRVRVADLTGAADPADPLLGPWHAAVPGIEAALIGAGNYDGGGAPQPLDKRTQEVERALRLSRAGDFGALGFLPDLLADLYHWTRDGTPEQQQVAWRALARACISTGLNARPTGYTSLAALAATAAEHAAEMLDDPLLKAAAAYNRGQVLLSTGRTTAASFEHARTAADLYQGELTGTGLELYGMLHLLAALTASLLERDPRPHLREAENTARRTGEGHELWLRFGPTNVRIWTLSIAVERGEGGRVGEIARGVNPEEIDTGERRSRWHIEVARAYYQDGDSDRAFAEILRAESTAPQPARLNTSVREMMGAMYRKAGRNMENSELGRLARRVGVTA